MSSEQNRTTPTGLRISAIAGLLFLHLPLALIFLYAFTTEEKSYQFPPPGYTTKWFWVAWSQRPREGAAEPRSLRPTRPSSRRR